MPGAAGGFAIREFREARPTHHVAVLHLDVAGAGHRAARQEIDPAGLGIADLRLQRVVAGERRDRAGTKGLGHEGVRAQGVDADPLRATRQLGESVHADLRKQALRTPPARPALDG